jgi:hypothetical protein
MKEQNLEQKQGNERKWIINSVSGDLLRVGHKKAVAVVDLSERSNVEALLLALNINDELIRMLERIENVYSDGDPYPSVDVGELLERAKGLA